MRSDKNKLLQLSVQDKSPENEVSVDRGFLAGELRMVSSGSLYCSQDCRDVAKPPKGMEPHHHQTQPAFTDCWV